MKDERDSRPDRRAQVSGAAAHGSDKPCEPDDPMSLEAIPVPLGELEAMSEAFVEEFARFGMSEDEIYLLFVRQVYFGTHLYFAKHGPEATRSLVRRVLSRTGVYRYKETNSDA